MVDLVLPPTRLSKSRAILMALAFLEEIDETYEVLYGITTVMEFDNQRI